MVTGQGTPALSQTPRTQGESSGPILTLRKALQGQKQMGELRTPTQFAICPDSRPSAGQPLLPTHHLPPCQALLLAPQGPEVGRIEQGTNLAQLPWTSPSGTSEGQGRVGGSKGVMCLPGS